MVEYKQIQFTDISGQKVVNEYNDGWEKDPDVSYNGIYGPDDSKILHLVRYTDEEKAEREASKQGVGPLNVVDVNILSVPIRKREDIIAGGDNPYKELAEAGWKEVHRTSTMAIMKLTDPRGILLSRKDLVILVHALVKYEDHIPETEPEKQTQFEVLYQRLSDILQRKEIPDEPTTNPE